MLFKDPNVENGLIMCDWKRSKEIKTSNKWQKGTHLLTAKMEDCNLNHYSLQLTIYKQILEQYYGFKITGAFIVVLHPDQDEYLKIAAKPFDDIVEKLFDERREYVQNLDKKDETGEPETKKARTDVI